MKKFRGLSLVAGISAVALSLSACAAPDDGANPTETEAALAPQITVAWNDIISEFNTSSATGNNVANGIITYMTSSGFSYYDANPELVKNTDFGTYEKVSDDPLTVKYTINDGVVWSDGTPIDGADLLLSWVAGFGYGNDGEGTFPFAHAAPRPDLASKLPTVEGNSITFEYDVQYVDWELQFGLGVATHGTVQMAYPDLSAADAKAKFIEAVNAGDWEWLTPVAEKWNTGYQYTNTPTDPKVTLSSGPYIVEELVEDQYVTLKVNELYNWGPKPQYERITVREIADSTAAVQAVENGDVQVASGQPTADVLALVQALAGAEYSTGNESAYEHVDLSVANGGPFDPASWGGDEDKARAVRQAFLLTIPRNQILDNLIKPLNPEAELRNSILIAQGFPGYDDMVAQNGSAAYVGTDEENLAKAQQILADAGITENIEVGFWYPEGNVRRGQEFELISANAALAGFTLVDESEPDWAFTGGDGASNPHDAVIFAWASTSLAVTGSDQYLSAGPSNWTGFQDDQVDALLTELNTALDPARQLEIQIEVEKILWAEGYGTTIFTFPGLTWWDAEVDGVSTNSLVPYFFWNFWDWKPVAQ